MTTKRYGLVAVCLLLAGLVFMAALGSVSSSASPSSGASDSTQLAGSTPSPAGAYGAYGSYGDASSSPSAGAAAGRPAGALAIRVDDQLGPVLTDGQGFTLYRFDKDTSKPPASNCSGACATTWPPAVNDATTSPGTGIDQAKLGEVARADGTRQLTVGGWPAYRYAQDTAPGDTKGQGVGGTWFALAPDGTKAKAAGADASASAAPTAPAPAGTMPQPSQQPQVKVQISVVMNPQLGQIMVDGHGRTLYHFGKDTAWPMRSNCEGQCLKTWPPAPPVDADKVKGVDPKLIGKLQRPDGTWQLSINCLPAYLYSGDQGYGDALGNGIDNQWSAINPQGKPAGK
ncbi:SCO0930 family lipoprotein [Kitasatospora indigofera]|uniref:SCO0930 family lipoprotein n=1 Tax=Kitasatospora indigofera TaxID=67307 RepID=UPI001E4BFAFC|nr:SCO0930 family lipoprotein [Kitasatospora indigofera]